MKTLSLMILAGTFFAQTPVHAQVNKKDLSAEALYKSLPVKAVDQDDVLNKTLVIPGLTVECLYWVVDKAYTCTVEKTKIK